MGFPFRGLAITSDDVNRVESPENLQLRAIESLETQQPIEEWEIDHSMLHMEIMEKVYHLENGCKVVYQAIYNRQLVTVLAYPIQNSENILINLLRHMGTTFKAIDHPNLAKFYGASIFYVGSIIHCLFVTNFVEVNKLKEIIIDEEFCKFRLVDVVKISLQLAEGLKYLHSMNIAHYSVRPRCINLRDTNSTLTLINTVIYNFYTETVRGNWNRAKGFAFDAWSAPEIFDDFYFVTLGKKTDVYSFGICLWQLFCCQLKPYRFLNPNQDIISPVEEQRSIINAVCFLNLRPPIPEHCPTNLADIMRRCWARDPNERPGMDQVVNLLKALIKPSSNGCQYPITDRSTL